MASTSHPFLELPAQRVIITNPKVLFKTIDGEGLKMVIDRLEVSLREHRQHIDKLDSLHDDDTDVDWYIHEYNKLLRWWNKATEEYSARVKASKI
jgi:type II secretory pathway component PulM